MATGDTKKTAKPIKTIVVAKVVKSGFTATDLAVEIIKKHEGYRAKAYWDVAGYSIGWGSPANSSTEVIDTKEAEKRLRYSISTILTQVEKKLPGLKEHEKGAIISLGYNCWSWYKAVLRQGPNKYNMTACVTADGKVLKGLQKRRANEWALFTKGVIY